MLSAATVQGKTDREQESSPLQKDNREIEEMSNKAKSFYVLNEGEKWRDITEEVLRSPGTDEESRNSIRTWHRRFIVFKYPSDNLWIKGFISFTPNPDNHPLLILYRWGNGNFALMDPGNIFTTYKNYTVISSLLRGGVSEGTDEFGGKDIDDMKNLMDFIPSLAKELNIQLNPSCVFMLGPSRGGMEMFLTLAHFPELQKRVNKIVSLSAILDMHQLIRDRPDDMKAMLKNQFGLKEGAEGNAWIARRDPLNMAPYLNKNLPILIIQGTADNRISLEEGHHMASTLKESGHNVNYWEIPKGNHVLMNTPSIMNHIAHWLESDTPCTSMSLHQPRHSDD